MDVSVQLFKLNQHEEPSIGHKLIILVAAAYLHCHPSM